MQSLARIIVTYFLPTKIHVPGIHDDEDYKTDELEVGEMQCVPRIGETVHLFGRFYTVSDVSWTLEPGFYERKLYIHWVAVTLKKAK